MKNESSQPESNSNPEKDEKGLSILNKTLESSPFVRIISVVELSRNSRDEHHFASMLLNIEDDLKDISEPMLFGIFGRFRVLEPLVGKGITTEHINYLIQFLTADCSCIIKTQMPGIDMLYLNEWDDVKPALLNTIITE